MKALPLSLRLVLAAATAVVGVGALASVSGASLKDASSGATPLPAGWELCILQGVNAPATQANVADLDEWQLAEGGSTNNTAAYNPFNTARTTDVNNTPLPLTISANGFPAFTDWIAGCAATVATILQPNMTTVAAGLRAGSVSPPPAFLAVVDQSQWCAPSADGTPCYSDMILGTTGELATEVLNASSALNVYGNVRSDLHSYEVAVLAAALAEQTVATTNEHLTAAQATLTAAHNRASASEAALRRFAVNEYVNSGLYQSSALLGGTKSGPYGTPSQDGVDAQQYSSFVAWGLLAQSRAASAAVKAAQEARNGVEKTLQQDVTTLTTDNSDQNKSLIRLVADVTTLQKAGACTTAVITAPTPPASTPTPSASTPASTGSSSSSSSSSTSAPSTTTTTVAPTTTTTSSTTTTTTTTPANVLPDPLATTTTVPTANTTTTSSTTTTTVPAGAGTANANANANSTAPPPTPNPSGLQVLSGCVTALAPTGSV